MNNTQTAYQNTNNLNKRLIRSETIAAPILITIPLFVSTWLIYTWYTKGLLQNNNYYEGELLIGLIILFGNLLFDIPFLHSLLGERKKFISQLLTHKK